MKNGLFTMAVMIFCSNLSAAKISNTANAYSSGPMTPVAAASPVTQTVQTGTEAPAATTSTVPPAVSAEKYPMPEELCGGLLYAGVDMWTGYSVRTKKQGVEVIIEKEELKKLLTADDDGKKYYDDSELKKIFMVSCSLAAAASVVYFLIESRFFDSGSLNSGRPAALIASGAAVPLLLIGSNWISNESFNDINRAVNVYNTNISCGLKKAE